MRVCAHGPASGFPGGLCPRIDTESRPCRAVSSPADRERAIARASVVGIGCPHNEKHEQQGRLPWGSWEIRCRVHTAQKSQHPGTAVLAIPGFRGAPSGTRTPNPLIKSQLLCQLS